MVVPYDTMSTNSVSSETMFSKCCCCIPLRVGCFILGYFSLFITSIRTLFVVGITIYYGFQTNGFSNMDQYTPSPEVEGYDTSATAPVSTRIHYMNPETIHMLGWILVIATICDLLWLGVNIACLVGLHKKRPGPIRTYVAFATCRLVFTTISYMYHVSSSDDHQAYHTLINCFTLGLTAYFVLVYYIYAMRLQKEIQQKIPELHVNGDAHIYPTKLDKQFLVD